MAIRATAAHGVAILETGMTTLAAATISRAAQTHTMLGAIARAVLRARSAMMTDRAVLTSVARQTVVPATTAAARITGAVRATGMATTTTAAQATGLAMTMDAAPPGQGVDPQQTAGTTLGRRAAPLAQVMVGPNRQSRIGPSRMSASGIPGTMSGRRPDEVVAPTAKQPARPAACAQGLARCGDGLARRDCDERA